MATVENTKTVTVKVKPEIDREAVEEAAQLAAALFLSSFAVAVLDGITAAEPPEEVLARVKAETLEKAAQEGRVANQDHLSHTHLAAPQPATDAPEPAQTLADLTPRLGDRVRVTCVCCLGSPPQEAIYAWIERDWRFGWTFGAGTLSNRTWTFMEHLEPVTPEEPPVGAGMLVDAEGDLWRRDGAGWKFRSSQWSVVTFMWDDLHGGYGPLRPATPADLARHGVGEDGEPVGKGEAESAWDRLSGPEQQAIIDAVADAMIEHGPDGHTDGCEEIARAAINKAGDRG